MRSRNFSFVMSIAALGLSSCAMLSEANTPVNQSKGEMQSISKLLVNTQKEFSEAVKHAVPGDIIVLANGRWADFDAVFDVRGTADKPITLMAQTPGEVLLTGQSSLRLAGEHIIVSGLVFKDGYTARNEVISFRRDSKRLANNARVTNTVIENYNNPDRSQRDIWVVMYGKNNEFDHNHLAGKLNSGPTMAVRLNTDESQNNAHHIHHNYFGPRPVLGSNGGETFRIGTSHYSLTQSNSLVENNFFDRCSGEVEIISNKSGGNTYRGNTFFESRGTLTLRHGNGTVVENNLFDGNSAPYTGGVRVINAQQTIQNNYFRNLTGTRFSGGLVVMNGVPNSPINRYHQVDGASINSNVFENVSSIELGEGSDAERSAVPINSGFKNNTLVNSNKENPFTLHDDMSGIKFEGNKTNINPPEALLSGFEVTEDHIQETDAADYGVAKEVTGVAWYSKPAAGAPFDTGKDIAVAPGENALSDALLAAEPGDRLVLEAGDYNEAKIINLRIPLTVIAAEGAKGDVNITFERKNLFVLSGNGGLKLSGVNISGVKSPDNVGNSFITTSSIGGGGNHFLSIENSNFTDFVTNRSFSVVSAVKGTFFHKVKIVDSNFRDISGSVVKLNAETDDYGMYNVEFLVVRNSTFKNIAKPAIQVYRGGRDESTFGPFVDIEATSFNNIADADTPSIDLHGVQVLRIHDTLVEGANPAQFTITTGKPNPDLKGNTLVDGGDAAFLTIEDLRK